MSCACNKAGTTDALIPGGSDACGLDVVEPSNCTHIPVPSK